MGILAQDVRYAWRTLRRSPGFAAVAILTLGLGIGATTAIFTIVHGVLLRPLPYREPDRIASLWADFGIGAQSLPAMSAADFKDYQRRSRSFEMLAAGSGGQVVGSAGALTGNGSATERVDVSPVTANFFPLLGVDPVYGRHFTQEEEAVGGPKVVILSYGLFQRRYGADPSIVGRSIRLDGIDQTVVGVMPDGFHLWLPPEAFLIVDSQIWKPLQFNYAQAPPRNFTGFTVFGRLARGVTFGEAQAEIDTIAAQLRAEHAELAAGDVHVRVVPLQHDIVKNARPALLALFGAVGFVLLIACANVAHLLLARATAREREMALRGALGASRARVLRQLVTESLVLAAAGGALGVALAVTAVRALVQSAPANLPRLESIHVDGAVLGFAFGASLLTAVLFGLVPALRAAGLDLNRVLRAASTPSGAQARLRNVLMVGEMALALVLLIGAGLMIRSFAALQEVRPGFEPKGVLTYRIALPPAKYRQADVRRAFYKQLESDLRAIPGVTDVGFISQLPLTGSGSLQPYAFNEDTARNWESETSDDRLASPAYFSAMGTRLLAGRLFDEHDAARQDIILIDDTLAARVWPGESAVGKRLQIQPNGSPNPYAEVIGVVEHIRMHDLSRAVRPQIYTPHNAVGRAGVVIRGSVDAESLAPAVRRVMERIDPDLPVDRLRPLSTYVDDALAQSRLNLVLMSLFGGAALLLASVGIYGVFSYAVGQRTREIGIRLALGQEPRQIRNLVLGEGARMIGISLGIGLFVAVGLSRAVASLLYGVNATDPATFALMAAVLALVALAGCYIPARRATTVNPLVALKTD